MNKGLRKPHLLLASGNANTMIENLDHILAKSEIAKITAELDNNVRALFDLGINHYSFASKLTVANWRQKVSRLYYAVYHMRRAIVLKNSGLFSTDSSDHKRIDDLPKDIQNRESHINSLKVLREDGNLADYSHNAEISDLVIDLDDALAFATAFRDDCRTFLVGRGVAL